MFFESSALKFHISPRHLTPETTCLDKAMGPGPLALLESYL